jgi:hypothetical protein
MTDLPYTDADLRTEATRQHADLTEDPDFGGVGEQMINTVIPSRSSWSSQAWWHSLEDGPGDGQQFEEAQRAIHDLINGAADTSAWAVNLGADGLTPDGHHADFGHHPDGTGPLMRLHFAFHSEADETDRHALAQLVTETVQDALNASLGH